MKKGNFIREGLERSKIEGKIELCNELISNEIFSIDELIDRVDLPDEVIQGLKRE